jgi:hypothetical protein
MIPDAVPSSQCCRVHDCQAKGRRIKARPDDLHPTHLQLWLCEYLGRNSGGGITLGRDPRRSHE